MLIVSLIYVFPPALLIRTESYILITANVDDVQALAKQIVASPVAGQLSKMVRRAASIFNREFGRYPNYHPGYDIQDAKRRSSKLIVEDIPRDPVQGSKNNSTYEAEKLGHDNEPVTRLRDDTTEHSNR
uniref:Uncharacterized protein n=1 Tax=Bombyx mori TaxID=7091 RepID=A0A8R2M1M2_BOMMO|nr:uncharacterized protein LOC101747105 isoform X1 [Bombyx mori]